MSKYHKKILVIYILLLIIFVPITLLSLYLKLNYEFDDDTILEEDNREILDDNTLYFYNQINEFLGSYTCESTCEIATSLIDDDLYSIDYLQTEDEEIQIYDDRYVFIEENNVINLYDIENDEIIKTYLAVKNYNNMLADDYVMVKSLDEKWGVIYFDQEFQSIIDCQYDFIGLPNILDESGLLNTSAFIVKNSSLWAILDNENDLISNYMSYEIVSYNNQVISLKNSDTYYLYDYNGKRVLNDLGFNYLAFIDDYIVIVTLENSLYIYDYLTDEIISDVFNLATNDYLNEFSISYDNDLNKIDLVVDNQNYSYIPN